MPSGILDGPTDVYNRVITDTLSAILKQVIKVLNMLLCEAFTYNTYSTLQSNSLGVDIGTRLGTYYNRDLVSNEEGTTLGEETAQGHKAQGG